MPDEYENNVDHINQSPHFNPTEMLLEILDQSDSVLHHDQNAK